MKRILLRTHMAIAKALACVLVGATAAVGVVQTIDHNDATAAQKASQAESHFWEVVAGENTGSPTVDVLLARDLRGLSAAEAAAFRGDSNRYGGITDAIGYDPFDETGLDCFECGPLDAYTKNNLALIRQGGIDEVLQGTEVPAPTEGLTLTPFGLSMISWMVLLWAVGGPLTLMGAHYTAKVSNERYAAVRRFDDVWADDDTIDRSQIALAPTFFGPYMLYRSATHRKFQERVRDAFPDQMEAIDRFDRALERAPVDTQTWDLLRVHRNEVVRELESQTRSGEGTDDEIKKLTDQITNVEEYLKVRLDAKRELNG